MTISERSPYQNSLRYLFLIIVTQCQESAWLQHEDSHWQNWESHSPGRVRGKLGIDLLLPKNAREALATEPHSQVLETLVLKALQISTTFNFYVLTYPRFLIKNKTLKIIFQRNCQEITCTHTNLSGIMCETSMPFWRTTSKLSPHFRTFDKFILSCFHISIYKFWMYPKSLKNFKMALGKHLHNTLQGECI